MPEVSVVIPTFGRPVPLTRAVASALAQTLRDVEVIVVVDGHDPSTVAALEAIDNPRLRWIVHDEGQGAGAARNTGARAARAPWIAFLDDDDEWAPTKLARQVAAAPARDALVITLYRVSGPLGTLIKPGRPHRDAEPVDEWLFDRHSWLRGGEAMLQTSAMMVPSRLFERHGFTIRGQHEDWEFAIRAVKQHGLRLVTVAEPLTTYHLNPAASLSKTFNWRASLDWIDTMRDVVTPRAYSGFCLTVATQGLADRDRRTAFATLHAAARRHGAPTARQRFAFALIRLIPHDLRQRLRATMASSTVPLRDRLRKSC
jgi:glycosyltransferase involved in cell wall biosynthesis